ncbi:hypothetical protein KKJ22_21475, partial [Xenorhabdus bovienii]
AEFFNRMACLNIPMVGVDPALVLCYRDEYKDILGEQRGTFKVQLVHEWLANILPEKMPQEKRDDSISNYNWYLLGHCTETTSLPNS